MQLNEAASCAYNESFTINFEGPLQAQALQEALNLVVHRHDILNVRFSPDGTFQEVYDSAPIELSLIDITALDSASQDAKLADVLDSEASTPFDLLNGPLVRVKLLRMSANRHVFVFSSHHIVYDGWSTSVLLEDLSEAYSALCEGRTPQLSEISQFSDYAMELQEEEGSDEEQEAEQYWLKQFADLPPVLDLPTDHPRPAIKSYDGHSVKVAIKPSVYRAIKQTAAEQNSTLFTTLFSAYNVFLSRLSGQKDIVVGIFSAGQAMSGHFNMIGHCVNFLPLRTRLESDLRFNELLSASKVTVLDAYDNYQVSFGRILRELKIERNPSRLPLVEVVFNLDKDGESPVFSGLNAKIAQAPKRAANFDLFFNINEIEGELVVDCDYSSELFDEDTIRRWIAHFETLLAGIAANPYARLADLPLLTGDERHKLLVEWNDTQQAYPDQATVHELFEEQVKRTPDAVAVSFPPIIGGEQGGAEELTYQELNQRANQLAHHLRAAGVQAETPVGISIERSLDMIVALLGVAKANGAYVPLDPSYPSERLAFMLEDANVQHLLTHESLLKQLPERAHRTNVICLDRDASTIAQQSSQNPVNHLTPDNLFYIIYTSGSTGQPKGVMGLHRGAINRFSWMWQTYPFAADEVCCQKTTLNFVDSVWEIFGPLLKGVPNMLIPDEMAKEPTQLVRFLAQKQVSRLVLVPSLLRMLLDSHDHLHNLLPNLKYWTTSGEALPVELYEQFRRTMPNATLLNIYGSSEVAADATYYDTAENVEFTTVPIGRPISNMQVYLLDEHHQPVSIGQVGEIYVGGAGLARGYVGGPELTEERFIPNPFTSTGSLANRHKSKARLYKTGDLGKYLPNGVIEFMGRRDHQIKIRGHRIELGEVETRLNQHPAVREGVVMAREDVPGDKRLVAYFVSQASDEPTFEAWQAFFGERLPSYMVPSAFVALDALPLTPNGKVNRLALPAPEESASKTKSFNPPENTTQKQVADIWAEVLHLSRVDIHANFFQLGGHSLLATQVISRLRDTFQVTLLLRHLFEAPTVASLASRIETMQWASQALVALGDIEEDDKGDNQEDNQNEEDDREFFEI